MNNIDLKDLLDAKFTHMAAKIEAQGTLTEEKINHTKEYIGERIDEVVRQQKIANHRVNKLEGETEKCKEFRAIAGVTPLWKKLPIYILVPIIFTLVGVGINDHYAVRDLESHSVADSTFLSVQASLMMHVEAKTRAMESLAKTNSNDIAHITQYIAEIRAAQDEIDKVLYREFRVRGPNDKLPEF